MFLGRFGWSQCSGAILSSSQIAACRANHTAVAIMVTLVVAAHIGIKLVDVAVVVVPLVVKFSVIVTSVIVFVA